ncbi:probable protein phosphatase 2C 49 [Tanacetum coccineum]
MPMGRIKVIKGCRVMMTGIGKRTVYTLEANVMTFGVQKHGDTKQGAQGDREAEVFQVSNDDAAVAQRRLEDKQLEEKANTYCFVKEQEKYMRSIAIAGLMVIKGRLGFTNVRTYAVSNFTRAGFEDIDFGWGKAIYAGLPEGLLFTKLLAEIDHEFGLENQIQDSLEFSSDANFDIVDFKQGMDDLDFDVVTNNISQNNTCVKVAMKCSASTKSIRSGSHTDIGARRSNEDQHIHIDDVANHLGDDVYKWATLPSSFYAVFDGHGGAEAASYVKEHAMRLFFESSDLPQATTLDGSVDELFLKELQDFHCKAFLQADKDLKEECSISDYCGTTAVTPWEKRCMKSESPLIAEPEMTQMVLTKDDEFMIIGCDGIWDVMSNDEAVNLVRKQLMQHNDPQRCATELINQALRLHTSDNLTAIVVCFSSHIEPPKPWRPRRGFRESAQKNEMEGTKKLLWIEDGYLNDELAVKQAFGCRRSAEQKQKSI